MLSALHATEVEMGLKDILDTLQEWVDENCTDDEHAEASRHIEDFRGMFGLEEE